ncbi:MAG: hypothetical protein L0387_39790 [Acidobacteria bacterium]|nr:hypothetical protein [Acidobacteriota bacterium]
MIDVCERTLSGHADEVREQQIGFRVFGRRSDYNTAEDNIVRVEAGELRKRLEGYFSAEGKDEPIVIRIPKGAYLPVFEDRAAPAAESLPIRSEPATAAPAMGRMAVSGEPAQSGELLTSTPVQTKPVKRESRQESKRPALGTAQRTSLFLLLAGLATLSLWLWSDNRTLRQTMATRGALLSSPSGIWPLLFDSSHHTFIVVADSCLAMFQDLNQTEVPLKDYISRKYLSALNTAEMKLLAQRQYTSVVDVTIAGKILQANAGHRKLCSIRYARDLQIRDFKTNHIILMGSRRSNPWGELFAAQRNFRSEVDPQSARPCYVNQSPKPGEQSIFCNGGESGTPDEAYALVTFIPNLSQTGNVLIIEGTTSEGTEAAGEFISDAEQFSTLTQILSPSRPGQPLPYFEVLLKTSTMAGTSKESVYVTHRILSPRMLAN